MTEIEPKFCPLSTACRRLRDLDPGTRVPSPKDTFEFVRWKASRLSVEVAFACRSERRHTKLGFWIVGQTEASRGLGGDQWRSPRRGLLDRAVGSPS
jgi:hypothetical protein